jgi:hypothetical protein
MYNLDIQSKIEMLPENAKQELFDFAEFLLSKYYKPLTKSPVKSKNKSKRYLFLNDDIWEGDIPSDLSENHDYYLYGE